MNPVEPVPPRRRPQSPRRLSRVLLLLLALVLATSSAAPIPASGVGSSPAPSSPIDQTTQGLWRSPVPAAELRPFAAPPSPWGAGHRGVDMGPLSAGATIRAPADGQVSFTGVVVDRPVLSIDHRSGYLSSFEPVEGSLEVGDAVSAGDPVGTLAPGNGHCTAPCLHWGVRLHGKYINPLLLTGDLEPSVLLPVQRLPHSHGGVRRR
ncbi:M23 family metallopeptidase [Nesterenkonia halotolerans]|uniref:M23 family metallopeptidase n=1 Tax=Nesterenkonia halotolerans TaxID=225325 RepID=UPI003EE7877E